MKRVKKKKVFYVLEVGPERKILREKMDVRQMAFPQLSHVPLPSFPFHAMKTVVRHPDPRE